jgi:hypothetical protein
VAGEGKRAHVLAQLRPGGDARAEDRGLGEPGAVGDPRERILANELDAALRELGERALNPRAKVARMASLTREQTRCVAG